MSTTAPIRAPERLRGFIGGLFISVGAAHWQLVEANVASLLMGVLFGCISFALWSLVITSLLPVEVRRFFTNTLLIALAVLFIGFYIARFATFYFNFSGDRFHLFRMWCLPVSSLLVMSFSVALGVFGAFDYGIIGWAILVCAWAFSIGGYGVFFFNQIELNVSWGRDGAALVQSVLSGALIATPFLLAVYMRRQSIQKASVVALLLITAGCILTFTYLFLVRSGFPDFLSRAIAGLVTFLTAKPVVDTVLAEEEDPNPGRIKGARLAEPPKMGFDEKPADDPYALRIAGKWLKFARTVTGVLVIGAIESGKTVIIRLMMQCVLPFIGKGRDWKAVVFDTKKEAYSILQGMGVTARIVNVCPFDERCAPWRLADDFTSNADANELGALLCPRDQKAEDMWANGAADITAGVVKAFLKVARDENGKPTWTLRDILEALGDVERTRAILKLSPASSRVLARYFNSDRTLSGFQATIGAAIKDLEAVAALWEAAEKKGNEPLSLKHWVNANSDQSEEEYIILVPFIAKYEKSLIPLYHLLYNRLFTYMQDYGNSKTRRRWFFLDEINALKDIPGFVKAVRELRSRGAVFIVGVQSLFTAEADFGEKEAKTAFEQFATIVALRLGGPEVAERVANMFGTVKLKESTQSWQENHGWNTGWSGATQSSGQSGGSNTGIQEHIKMEPLFMKEQFMFLPPTSEEDGLTAFIKSYDEAYQRTLEGEELFKRRLEPMDEAAENFLPVNESTHELLSWTMEDLKRLRIDHVKAIVDSLYREEEHQPKTDAASVATSSNGATNVVAVDFQAKQQKKADEEREKLRKELERIDNDQYPGDSRSILGGDLDE